MPRKKKDAIQTDEVSLSSVTQEANGVEKLSDDEVELVSSYGEIEELSEEAKKMQERAIAVAREQAVAAIDRKKLPLAIKEINGIQMAADIFDDAEVLERVKENINTAMDLKFLAEWQKIRLQNLQTLMRMDSVKEDGTAGEIFVGVEFGSSGGGTTKVVVSGKR